MGEDTTFPRLRLVRMGSDRPPPRALRLMLLLGTRPEAVKLAPIAVAARAVPGVEARLVSSGQHPEAMLEVLHQFGLDVHSDLELFHPGQTLAGVMSAAVKGFATEIEMWRPDFVVVQGDTTSALAGALAAFYARVPVAHVEAGLRSHDFGQPFPEEMNRKAIDAFADILFAPTPGAELNLVEEGADGRRIFLAGNTVVDALVSVLGSSGFVHPTTGNGATNGNGHGGPGAAGNGHVDVHRNHGHNGNGDHNGNGNGHHNGNGQGRPWLGRVLVTAHRRESWGAGLEEIAAGLALAAARFPDRQFLVPLHPNPVVRRSFGRRFPGNVSIVDPLPYREFVHALASSDLVVTDSGGVVEEATCLGIPTLIVRLRTERPEAVESGLAAIIGMQREDVDEAVTNALSRPMTLPVTIRSSVFGDGRAGERIVDWLRWRAGRTARRPKPFRPPRQLPGIERLLRGRLERVSP
jgi:UDP-N-acetylglucosamine 2-epimerase (non-hydrolysing)